MFRYIVGGRYEVENCSVSFLLKIQIFDWLTTFFFLSLCRTMNNSESGRKINHAINTSSRAVGGALTHAKGAILNFWSAMTTQPTLYNEDDTLNKRNLECEDESIDDTNLDANGCNVMNDSKEEHFHSQENHGGVVEIGREANFIDRNII